MVLLSNLMFSKSYFENCFPTYFCIDDVFQNIASGSNTKTVLLSEAVFFKDIPNWHYFRSYCFQTNILRMVFQCIIKLTMSLKTLLLTVIPKRYYCQRSVFQRNTKMVLLFMLLFKLLFPM